MSIEKVLFVDKYENTNCMINNKFHKYTKEFVVKTSYLLLFLAGHL